MNVGLCRETPPAFHVGLVWSELPKRWYSSTSAVSQRAALRVAKKIVETGFTPLDNTGLRQSWVRYARKQGVRFYRPHDWNLFWHSVSYKLTSEVPNISFYRSYAKVIREYFLTPAKQSGSRSRSDYLSETATPRELRMFEDVLSELLIRASYDAEKRGEDYPAWFSETDSLKEACFNARFRVGAAHPEGYVTLRAGEDESVSHEATFPGVSSDQTVGLQVQPQSNLGGPAILIIGGSVAPATARQIAYSLLEAADAAEKTSNPTAAPTASYTVDGIIVENGGTGKNKTAFSPSTRSKKQRRV